MKVFDKMFVSLDFCWFRSQLLISNMFGLRKRTRLRSMKPHGSYKVAKASFIFLVTFPYG
jgi:hypothetical protein